MREFLYRASFLEIRDGTTAPGTFSFRSIGSHVASHVEVEVEVEVLGRLNF
jgi:hypothetical protein